MTATKGKYARGQHCRGMLEAALRAAGDRGAATQDLVAATGLSVKLILYYGHTLTACVRATPRAHVWARWFHTDFAAQAKAYVDRCDASPKERRRWSEAKAEEARAIVDAAGPVGASLDDIHKRVGLSRNTTSSMLSRLRADGKVKAGFGVGNWVIWYGAQYEPAPRAVKERVKRIRVSVSKPKPERPAKVKAPRPVKLKAAKAKPSKTKAKTLPAGGPVDMSRAKTTIALTPLPRFHVDKPEPFFSGLQIGSYLHTGSAIEQAYGGGK